MLRKLTSSLLLTLLIFSSTTSNAFSYPQILTQNPARRELRQNRQRILDELNLTDAQKQEINRIRQQNRPKMQALRQEIQAKQAELQTLMAGNSSDSQLRSKHEQITALRQDMASLHFDNMLEIRKVLTPAQRSQFAQLMQQHRGRGHGGPGWAEPLPADEL
jgi:Spy/CpxP family protein refolding chaperone